MRNYTTAYTITPYRSAKAWVPELVLCVLFYTSIVAVCLWHNDCNKGCTKKWLTLSLAGFCSFITIITTVIDSITQPLFTDVATSATRTWSSTNFTRQSTYNTLGLLTLKNSSSRSSSSSHVRRSTSSSIWTMLIVCPMQFLAWDRI